MTAKFDVLIRGATIFDGTGAEPFEADIGIEGDKIAAIGSLDSSSAVSDVNAEGLALCPGFIDAHTHDDFAALAHPDMGFKLRGGVTTCVVGNCGFGAAPYTQAVDMLGNLTPGMAIGHYDGYAGYADSLRRAVPGVNIGVLAGHGTIRKAVVGSEAREPSDAEMHAMHDHLHEAMDAGALGFSSGLIYDPGRYASTDELATFATAMRGTRGIYATHMRDEGIGLLDSIDEAIAIGEAGGVGVQISHHKASGRESWGLVNESLKKIEAAQARGIDIHADQYPYTAGSTSLQAVLENGAFADKLSDAADVNRGGLSGVSPDDVVIASCPGHPKFEGCSIRQVSNMLGLDALPAARDVVARSGGTTVILHMMSEDDVQTILRHPSTMIGSDGIPTLDGKPHPRLYNSFARVLGHYARDVGVFDLATAVHRMTGFAATKFNLAGRGVISQGAFADIVLFYPKEVIDKGTFEDPNQFPQGIGAVYVNGTLTVDAQGLRDKRAGQVLMRSD